MNVLHEPKMLVKFDSTGALGERLAGVGTAQYCACSTHHEPTPLRYVWHHILPVACGGTTITANLVSVCDSCHYGIHVLLTQLKKNGGSLHVPYSRFRPTVRYHYAVQGYQAAVAAGTVDKIPNEGGSE
jgi:HNH endonuclease